MKQGAWQDQICILKFHTGAAPRILQEQKFKSGEPQIRWPHNCYFPSGFYSGKIYYINYFSLYSLLVLSILTLFCNHYSHSSTEFTFLGFCFLNPTYHSRIHQHLLSFPSSYVHKMIGNYIFWFKFEQLGISI